ncbi:MAG: (d)CMP kinase [Deltaproteobacteria bacterium]|nr:MAG: (d)CMP kinase [Deltaproteobacteria bacterium]
MTAGSFVVTIDGPAGAGKSTTARAVADRLGLRYLDSGALYRALALAGIEDGVDLDDERGLAELAVKHRIELGRGGAVLLDGRDVRDRIRSPEVSDAASRASRFEAVRRALVDLQRAAAAPPGAVAEGRDMGTVVFPDADLKVFLDADPEERLRRRARDLGARAGTAEYERLRRAIAERDQRDRNRAVAPLRPAEDAVRLDSTRLSQDEVVTRIVAEAERRRAKKRQKN